jgi:hypothetical protein
MKLQSRPRGKTALIVVSSVLGGAALALMFVVLPYMNAKEEEAQRELIGARKAADESARQAAEARRRAAEAEGRVAAVGARESDTGVVSVEQLKLRCEWEKKSPASPSHEARVHQACTRYDDAVRRQHVEALNRERGFAR